jgi:hypothetical protein
VGAVSPSTVDVAGVVEGVEEPIGDEFMVEDEGRRPGFVGESSPCLSFARPSGEFVQEGRHSRYTAVIMGYWTRQSTHTRNERQWLAVGMWTLKSCDVEQAGDA